MEDGEILALYEQRSGDAVTETDKKYRNYCTAIAQRILGDASDAEEAVNDTWMKAWNTIPPIPASLRSYLGMLCRGISLNRLEKAKAGKRASSATLAIDELAECLTDGSASDPADTVALTEALNRFLRSLPKKTRVAFVERYWYMAPVGEIASSLGMKENAVSMLLSRTRKKLETFLKEEGFGL